MSLDVFNVYTSTAYQIDYIWFIFMGVHIGFFGLIFHYRELLSIFERVIVLIGYFVFAFMNMRSLIAKYYLLTYVRKHMLSHNLESSYPYLATYLHQFPLSNRVPNVIVIHVVIGLAVTYYTFSDRFPFAALPVARRLTGIFTRRS